MSDLTGERAVNTPDYWLGKARTFRAAAQATDDARARRHLLGSAEGYERVAQYLESQSGAPPPTPRAA